MKVCWFSTGISSFVACYLAKDVDEIIYTHVPNQHPDSLRFLHDCERVLGREITILQSDEYESVDDVIEKRRCINTLIWCTVYRMDEKESENEMGARAPGTSHLCLGI